MTWTWIYIANTLFMIFGYGIIASVISGIIALLCNFTHNWYEETFLGTITGYIFILCIIITMITGVSAVGMVCVESANTWNRLAGYNEPKDPTIGYEEFLHKMDIEDKIQERYDKYYNTTTGITEYRIKRLSLSDLNMVNT